jgi:hypothetical protein
VSLHPPRRDRARASSEELKAAMTGAGVTGKPEIWFTTRI